MRRLKKDPKAKRRNASSSTEWDNSDEEVEDIVRNWRPGKAMRKRIKEADLTNLQWSDVFPRRQGWETPAPEHGPYKQYWNEVAEQRSAGPLPLEEQSSVSYGTMP